MADLKEPDEVQGRKECGGEALNEREFFLKFAGQLGAQ
jgi:hypothetical protein